MILIFFISIGLSIGYIYLLQWIVEGWESTEWQFDKNELRGKVTVSIIIAARNEELHIANCLSSIFANKYPQELLEVIVVDDQSEDQTYSIVHNQFPQVTLLQTSHTLGKKSAIQIAANQAQGELLLFTDADCHVPSTWIRSIVANYDIENTHFIAAPIEIDLEDTILSRFQYLDVAATMAVTANGIHRNKYYSANGANMAVQKNEFLQLYSSRSDSHLASGDDMFAIQFLAKKDPSKITFISSLDATVTTKGESTVSDLLQQRKRWASKSRHYPDKNIVLVQGYVFVLVLAIVFNAILGVCTDGLGVFTAVMILFIKTTLDYLFLSHICNHFEKKEATKKYLISAALYNLYILYAGLAALLATNYQWKGRDVK